MLEHARNDALTQRARYAAGWTMDAWFTSGGRRGGLGRGKRVQVINPECGTNASSAARLAFLKKCLGMAGSIPTVQLTSAGFFGSATSDNGDLTWQTISNLAAVRNAIGGVTDVALPESSLLAVGVDVTASDQRQWWFERSRGLICEVERWHGGWKQEELERRKVQVNGLTLLGFVCGEVYEWPEEQVRSALRDVDVVAVSAHVEVNRQWQRRIAPTLRRWAFQRRFQMIASRCGAALAQSHTADYDRVRACDNWFVYRNGRPFPGQRQGTRVELSAREVAAR